MIDLSVEFGLTHEAEAVAAMVHGASSTMTTAGLPPQGVMDLIPVKPLAAIEPSVEEAYVNTLGARLLPLPLSSEARRRQRPVVDVVHVARLDDEVRSTVAGPRGAACGP